MYRGVKDGSCSIAKAEKILGAEDKQNVTTAKAAPAAAPASVPAAMPAPTTSDLLWDSGNSFQPFQPTSWAVLSPDTAFSSPNANPSAFPSPSEYANPTTADIFPLVSGSSHEDPQKFSAKSPSDVLELMTTTSRDGDRVEHGGSGGHGAATLQPQTHTNRQRSATVPAPLPPPPERHGSKLAPALPPPRQGAPRKFSSPAASAAACVPKLSLESLSPRPSEFLTQHNAGLDTAAPPLAPRVLSNELESFGASSGTGSSNAVHSQGTRTPGCGYYC